MCIRMSVVLFLSTLLNITVNAQWVSINPSYAPGSDPQVQLISSSESETIIKVELPGYYLNTFQSGSKLYQSIDIGEQALTTETGYPEIPHIAKLIAIPDKGTVNLEVIEKSDFVVQSDVAVPPVRVSWKEGDPEPLYSENQKVYNSEESYPAKFAAADDPVIFRDFRLSRISIYPISYIPARKELRVLSSITVRVTFGPGTGINPKTSPLKPIAPSFAKLYRSTIFNYNQVLQSRYDGRETGHDIMLCIMPDNLYNSFQPYAQWKHKSGTEIIQKKFSEIGATANNPVAIKNYIFLQNTGTNPATHVLLVGDHGVAPISLVTYDYTFPNENYFVEIEGNDYFPDLLIGRFTNQEEYRLQVMVNKFIGYERNPELAPGNWYSKGIVTSNDAYASQLETKRFAAENMRNYGFVSVDTMMSKNPCLYTLADVTNAINSGRSYLNYRGEGWSTGWWADCYRMTTTNVNALNNGRKLTFVTSIGCGVAMFNASGVDNCFGEAWIEIGTPTEPRGACAFVGPTSNTHTTYNNKIDKGIYVGMFQEGMDSPGEALLRGRIYMYNVYGNIQWVEYHFRVYCVLGDPSLHVWKDIPLRAAVNYPAEITVGYSQVQVSVIDSLFGIPMENARVCISGDGVYASGITGSNGIVILDVISPSTGQLNITITGGKVIPFEGTLQVIPGTENVTPNGVPQVADINGNLDGKINPNENCTMKFVLKNWGTVASQNVYAKISVPDSIPYVQMIVDSVNFGTISPNDTIAGAPFSFHVTSDCPVGYTLPFKLLVTSDNSSWNYSYNFTVQGCQLELVDFYVDDEGNLLRNFRMDPGETVKLRFRISNRGSDNAPGVHGLLTSNDQYIQILDSLSSFGTLLPDSSLIDEDDFFIMKASENCPVKYRASLGLKLSTSGGFYPYSKNINFNVPVAMPSPPDPTGPDAYGYFAYSSNDNLWQQAPVYNWFELDGIGTQIPKPSGVNDFTTTVNLPFTFKYYGIDQNQLRISSDGWIAFGSGNETAFLNRTLPCNDTINNMAAAFWDDLFTNTGTTGKLLYYFDEPNHRFIIEWFEVPHFSSSDDIETFQILLLDPSYYPTSTGDGELIFQYKTVEEPGSCTIGIEDNTETIGMLYVMDEVYDVTANEINGGLAIKFTTTAPVVVSVEDQKQEIKIPDSFSLEQNYPNPFNPSTRIIYNLPNSCQVSLKIYRIEGELIRTIKDEYQSAGRHEVLWDGKNEQGAAVSSGVYFYTLYADEFVKARKMVLLK
jgi:hypothetical protein